MIPVEKAGRAHTIVRTESGVFRHPRYGFRCRHASTRGYRLNPPHTPHLWYLYLVGPVVGSTERTIMVTTADVTALAVLAGPEFGWDGVRGCHRPAADVRTPLRLELLGEQGGVCFWCGDAATEPEFCHLVSRGPSRKGWLPGNIGIGCASCNDCRRGGTGDRVCDPAAPCQRCTGPVLPVSRMARPDVIASEWIPFPVLRKRG